jgi:hypothetical protein
MLNYSQALNRMRDEQGAKMRSLIWHPNNPAQYVFYCANRKEFRLQYPDGDVRFRPTMYERTSLWEIKQC